MRTALLLLATILLFAFGPAGAGEGDAAGEGGAAGVGKQSIEEAIENYFTGVSNNDVDSMKKAFHPDTVMFYVKDGALVQVTQPQWHARMRESREAPKALSREIVSIDTAGDVAAVKTVSTFDTFQYIDFITLARIGERWMIVNKVFHRKEL